jgi:Trk-type K+ transport system membrane component
LNKLSLILLMSLATVGAYAQSTGGGVTMSTDPAKAAAVEKHAQELQARQSKEATSKPAATHTSTKKTKGKTSGTHKSSTAKPAKAPKS